MQTGADASRHCVWSVSIPYSSVPDIDSGKVEGEHGNAISSTKIWDCTR